MLKAKKDYVGQTSCIASDGWYGVLDIDEDRIAVSTGVPQRASNVIIRKLYYSHKNDDYFFTDGYGRYYLNTFIKTI